MPRTTTRDADALLSEGEVQRLLGACSERAPTGVRNRALVALLYCSGLRIGEALALRPEDCPAGAGDVSVRGPRRRRAHLFAAAGPYLDTWHGARAVLSVPVRAPLFCTLAGDPLEPAYVRAMLARLGRRAGLGKRVHAHLLRHSCAARLARSGVAADAVAEQLGHAEGRGSARSLRRFGVPVPTRGLSAASRAAWGLAPEPGAVRAIVRGARRLRPVRGPRGGIVVRRWRPQEL